MTEYKPKVCSLFAGIGGIDTAFEQAGFEIVWANEIDKDACKTYRHNFPNTVLFEGNIKNEVEELITHNIFYTAITRAKEDLKIYWTPETEKKILEGLSLRNYNKDAALLTELKSLK